MKIKGYIQFVKEAINGHEFGCVMIEVPATNWDEITSMIDPEDVYIEKGKYGIEDNPHVTLLYGLHKGVSVKMVKKVFSTFDGVIDLEINGIGIFENPKFDVVKFNVNPEGSLQYLFDRLSELPNSNEFPNYMPHITIAFLKKGTGRKYINPNYKHVIENATEITYSMVNGMVSYFNINESVKTEYIREFNNTREYHERNIKNDRVPVDKIQDIIDTLTGEIFDEHNVVYVKNVDYDYGDFENDNLIRYKYWTMVVNYKSWINQIETKYTFIEIYNLRTLESREIYNELIEIEPIVKGRTGFGYKLSTSTEGYYGSIPGRVCIKIRFVSE